MPNPIFGVNVINYGPLTTTFTAPSTCAADQIVFFDISIDDYYPISCPGIVDANCYPSGSYYVSIQSSYLAAASPSLWLGYYSPGIICPSDWATYGIAVPISTDASFSLSGVFTTALSLSHFPTFLSMLKPQETLVACCPRYSSLRLHHET
jgi:hypothetical protein